jgi:uncharacterized oxidoreductase
MLKGKTILITGGGSGIGEAFATILSKNNNIIICGRNEERLKRVAATSSNITYYVADISSPTEIDNLFKRIASNKVVLDVLFNNAGVVEKFEIMKSQLSSVQIFEKINTNLSGAIAITQHFINQANKSTSALIVNVTAGIAIFPVPVLALYSTSKTGLSVFTKALRQQLKSTNFKVIEILPPHVETAMPKEIGNTAKGEKANDFAGKAIGAINGGKTEYAPGINVILLKIFSKFLPKAGLNLIDKVTRKQWQG